jgi:phage repressor protein C with HTH and peptisase S24 domain
MSPERRGQVGARVAVQVFGISEGRDPFAGGRSDRNMGLGLSPGPPFGVDGSRSADRAADPRPANLNGVRGAYAIYMVGDSMEPRYEQGWLLHVNPFKPPTRGRDVVVYKKGDAVLIKQFVRWEGDALVLRQLNPGEELRVPRDEVMECHLVVGVDQEG